MAIVGFNIDKINAERKDAIKGKVEVKSNIDISDIKKSSLILDPDRDTLKISFNFSILYEPNFAKIEFEGHVLILESADITKQILDDWKKKKMDLYLKEQIYNLILRKATIKALSIEEDLNLIPHMPMPSVKAEEGKEKEKK
jgi:hypothetical protein